MNKERFRATAIVLGAIACAVGVSACFNTSDDEYVAYVNQRLAPGPAEACCLSGTANADPARLEDCKREAVTRCAFVRGARVVKLTGIGRFGEDTGASVDVDIAGPNGRGYCRYQVYRNGRMEYGSCFPEGTKPP
jgi:hypothetical protein